MMNKTITQSILLFILFTFSLSAMSACLKEGDNITLTGVLKKELVYGPPNWGEDPEHDEKLYYWFIYPDKPLECVTDANHVDTDWNKSMQLDLSDNDYNKYEHYLNHRVAINGSLRLATIGNDNTPVLLTDIKDVSEKDIKK